MEWINFLVGNWQIISGIIVAIFAIIGVKWLSTEKLQAILQVIGEVIELVESQKKKPTSSVVLEEMENLAKKNETIYNAYKKVNKSVEKNEDVINKVIQAKEIAKNVGETIQDAKHLAKFTRLLWKGVKKIL